MKDRVFLDTNVLVYLFTIDEPVKQQAAIDAILESQCLTGLNNISEFSNVLLKKYKIKSKEVIEAIQHLTGFISVVNFDIKSIETAISISQKYKYSYYDSLVLAIALENNCSKLYSEDMQHKQLIENKLMIFDIFQ